MPVYSQNDLILNNGATNVNTKHENVNSAAFQDHFMKNLKLGSLDPFKKKNPLGGVPPRGPPR